MILYQHIMIKTWQNWSFNNIYSPTLVLLNCFFNYGHVIIQHIIAVTNLSRGGSQNFWPSDGGGSQNFGVSDGGGHKILGWSYSKVGAPPASK